MSSPSADVSAEAFSAHLLELHEMALPAWDQSGIQIPTYALMRVTRLLGGRWAGSGRLSRLRNDGIAVIMAYRANAYGEIAVGRFILHHDPKNPMGVQWFTDYCLHDEQLELVVTEPRNRRIK